MTYTWDYLLTDNASPMYKSIAQHVEDCGAQNILDIGCGHARWLDYYNGNGNVVGIDNNKEAIDYCNERHNGNFTIGDAWNINSTGSYDTIVLGGILYYFKHDVLVLDYINSLIDKFNPKFIVIQEPFPSISHNSPDFIPLLDKFAWHGEWFDLDIRMGQRIVITLQVDKIRPQRKIRQQPSDTKSHFDDKLLKFGVYTANTEEVNSAIDGEILPPDPSINNYASVCAGFKSMYKGCLDYVDNKSITYTWYDVSPTAVLFKMFQDMMKARHPNMSWDDLLAIYKKDYDPRLAELKNNNTSIDTIVDTQLNHLGISKDTWTKWLTVYNNCKPTYVKCDIVSDVKYAAKHLKDNTWLWYSNVFDWHQFSFPDKSKMAWTKVIGNNNTLIGKTILTNAENLTLQYVIASTPVTTYESVAVEVVNRLWSGLALHDFDHNNIQTKERQYAFTVMDNKYKVKIYLGYNAVIAKANYNRCKHLIPGKHHCYEYKGIRAECYEYIQGDTLDNVNIDIKQPLINLINTMCEHTIPVYPYDISKYNMVYDGKQIHIIDWDYTIAGTRQELMDKIKTAMEIDL